MVVRTLAVRVVRPFAVEGVVPSAGRVVGPSAVKGVGPLAVRGVRPSAVQSVSTFAVKDKTRKEVTAMRKSDLGYVLVFAILAGVCWPLALVYLLILKILNI